MRVQAALASGLLQPAALDAASAILSVEDAPPEASALLGRHESACVFFETTPATGPNAAGLGGRCRIHAALGHDALPLACRQFPRVSVVDPRGVSVTLSHYCPTAAGLLDIAPTDGPSIAVNPPAFPPEAEYVGLDARQAWPPLLRPGMLMDWDSWWLCEALAVSMLDSRDAIAPFAALAKLQHAIAQLQPWKPDDGPLADRVRECFANAAESAPDGVTPHASLVDAVFDAIPATYRPARFTDRVVTTDRVARAFLSAHAFANWNVHVGQGLDLWVRSIEAAAALLDAGAGVRTADLLLRHLADTDRLARRLEG